MHVVLIKGLRYVDAVRLLAEKEMELLLTNTSHWYKGYRL